jgi:nucleoside-diphosphate-sugar epimerase/putative sterol carrier protein
VRVAVTGGSGHLGTLVLRRLADERTVEEIVALDVRPPLIVSGKLRDVRADVRDQGLGKHLQGCDALVHLAFMLAKRADRAKQDSVNVEGSKNVFRSAIDAGVKCIVYASSVAAYGVVPGLPVPVVESTPRTRQPGFWYACAKYDVESFLDELEQAHAGVSIARMRPSVLIGRRIEHRLGSALRRGVIPDGGAGAMPLVWDEDVADGFLLALKQGARGAFNLSANEPLPARELAQAAGMRVLKLPLGALRKLEKALAVLRLLPPFDPGWLEATDFPLVYSSERARRELGWKPRCSTAREVMCRYAETVPRKLDRRLALWARLVDRASRGEPPRPELAGYEAVVHLDLTGPGGGDFALEAHGGKVRLKRGAPRSANAAVTLKASLFLELLAGKTDFAGAQLSGRVRVDGQGLAGLLIGGLVAGFHAAGRGGGVRGISARGLKSWMAT